MASPAGAAEEAPAVPALKLKPGAAPGAFADPNPIGADAEAAGGAVKELPPVEAGTPKPNDGLFVEPAVAVVLLSSDFRSKVKPPSPVVGLCAVS